jgi:hypothetical protein
LGYGANNLNDLNGLNGLTGFVESLVHPDDRGVFEWSGGGLSGDAKQAGAYIRPHLGPT